MAGDGRPAAAFFDLDKTLIEGSSAFQFARAAYRAKLLGRRQLLSDAVANVRFRLRGATDEDSLALRERIAASLEGTRVTDLERLGVDVLAGILPRVYPKMLALAHEHQDAGRRSYIVTAASQELADILARVMAFDGAIGSEISEVVDGVYTGRPAGLFIYGAGQGARDRAARGAPTGSISLSPTPTRIRSPICRCSAPSVTRWRSTPTPSWRGSRARRAGRSCASTASGAGCGRRP